MKLADFKSTLGKKDFRLKSVKNRVKEQRKLFGPESSGPQLDLFYGFLCIIYDGIDSIEKIKKKMRWLFLSTMSQLVIEDQDIEEYIHLARYKNFIKLNTDDNISLTDQGKAYVEKNYCLMLITSHWMHKFLSEKFVLIITAISLFFLSILKICFGMSIDSQGMISEGLENLTDMIKIAIIYFGIRFHKDRTASIVIILLMIFTGLTLIWSSIESLINLSPIMVNFESFLIGGLSILINRALMYYKGIVGRASGNLSLLSDSKDSEINSLISIGVLIGLFFAIFKWYIIDSFVSLIIAGLIIKEGIEFLRELIVKEDEFDISTIHVKADNIYKNRLTGYLIANIRRNRISSSKLLIKFEEGLGLGRTYWEGWADFFYDELGEKIARKHLNKLIEGKEIKEIDNELILTPKGIDAYHKAKSRQYSRQNRRNKRDSEERNNNFVGIIWITFTVLIITLLIIYGPKIVEFINSFIQ